MRILVVLVVCFWTQAVVAAATFVGQVQATFRVTEVLDGTTTTANKTGPLDIALVTDYTNMRWSIDFDVDLLMAGGPGQSFETRLLANGSVTSRRCASSCSLTGLGDPSPLSFPDANGRSGAGSYVLLGSAEWTLSDRIVNAVRERHSPEKAILGSGYASGSDNTASVAGSHYLSVFDYPNNIQLTPGLSGTSSWQDQNGQWVGGFISGIPLGRITDDNNYLELRVIGFPSIVTLNELLAGDFNDSGAVDAADYVTWRKGSGLLSGFLSSHDVWRANFGTELGASSAAGLATTVPEPASLALVLVGAMAIVLRRQLQVNSICNDRSCLVSATVV